MAKTSEELRPNISERPAYYQSMKPPLLASALVTFCVSGAFAQTAVVEADVAFMQNMIAHHAQALEMTAMTATHSQREDIKLLARRISDSQASETALMESWLRRRNKP